MSAKSYNSVWQLRADTWCRLEDAAGQLSRLGGTGRLADEHQSVCAELLALLSPVEPYWAYPSGLQFARLNRMFAAGEYDKFAQSVAVAGLPSRVMSARSRTDSEITAAVDPVTGKSAGSVKPTPNASSR